MGGSHGLEPCAQARPSYFPPLSLLRHGGLCMQPGVVAPLLNATDKPHRPAVKSEANLDLVQGRAGRHCGVAALPARHWQDRISRC